MRENARCLNCLLDVRAQVNDRIPIIISLETNRGYILRLSGVTSGILFAVRTLFVVMCCVSMHISFFTVRMHCLSTVFYGHYFNVLWCHCT